MGQQWYYTRNGERHGPVTAATLKQLARSSELSPSDLVWSDGMKDWVAARNIKGLFPQAPPDSIPQPPPLPAAGEGESGEAASREPGLSDILKNPKKLALIIGGGIVLCLIGVQFSHSLPSPLDQLLMVLFTVLLNAWVIGWPIFGLARFIWRDVNKIDLSGDEIHVVDFASWYKKKFGRLNLVVQYLMWLYGGYVWIPVYYYAFSVSDFVASLRRFLEITDENDHLNNALEHFVVTMRRGGELQFEPLSFIADHIRAKHTQGGQVDLTVPAVRFGGTPVKLIRFWEQKYKINKATPQGGDAAFIELNNKRYPDDPADVKERLTVSPPSQPVSVSPLGAVVGSQPAAPTGERPSFWAYLFPFAYECPSCRRWRARIYDGSREIDRAAGTATEFVRDRHYDSQGQSAGHTDRQIRKPVINVTYLDHYHCRFCRATWTGTSQRSHDV